MSRYWTVYCMNPATPGRGSSVVFGPLDSPPTAEQLRTADSLLSESLMLSLGERLLLVGNGLTVQENGTEYHLICGTTGKIVAESTFVIARLLGECSAST